MTTFSLGQEWVSRVTSEDDPDVPVVGANLASLPSKDALGAFLDDLSRSETVREMARRKWLKPVQATGKARVSERGNALLDFLNISRPTMPAQALFRGRRSAQKIGLMDELAERAWVAHVTDVARECARRQSFDPSRVSKHFVQSLAQKSVLVDGPRLALNALKDIGICVVVEGNLPGMSIDGASFHTVDIGPVIALTVRHDRLDNFWFTLFHEIGHILLHLSEPSDQIYVDSEEDGDSAEAEAEAEADAFAKDGLIPRDTWLRSDARRQGNEASVLALARQLEIHPAIVAGRIRYERRDFRIFNDLIGRGQVRETIFDGR
ncbi:ImmA/IrrE family metallo-endopeptidase [Burkholderia pyrrocinia]|uniref:ImmA/IrrE family metallo-endopeptidase n=1 Tax=Burkholderia pyrrocinia TaxID=60550 RepID=UPI002AB22304|nr:ImmA/IrrE family metallo-endopeptidase [Burkholderia pyrrocinia]